MGELLRVDLSSHTSREESIPTELVRRYVGGKGLGTHILLEEVGPEVEPLAPGNKVVFVVGPMAGTSMPGSNRYAAYFLSPLTGGYCESYAGGQVATQFARTGYHAVILEGTSATPVFLEVSERGVAFHPADDVWGLETYDAQERLLAKVGIEHAQACVIGPAGENLVRFALVENNKWRSLGRGGCGAVLGSKKVKGIVWHGKHRPEVARPQAFKELVKDILERGKDDPGVAAYKRMGTVQMVRVVNGVGAFPTRYWTKGRLDDFEPLSGETMVEKYQTGTTVCPPCIMRCGNLNRVPEGPLAGLEIDGPEYETINAFGGICEIVDFAQIMRLNDICDRLGIDTMTAGNLCGLAIEACRQGVLDLGLDFGDADGVADLLQKIAGREGVGDLFADGILAVEKHLGLQGVAVHVKGMEPAAFDPRFSKGMGLSYAMTSRGACHLRTTFYKPELAGLIPADATAGKASMVVDWEDRLCIMDTLIYCRFYRDLVAWPYITHVVNAVIGSDFNEADLHRIADRIVTETHEFNLSRGFGPETERLPAGITERPLVVDGQERRITADELELMRKEYYSCRHWRLSD